MDVGCPGTDVPVGDIGVLVGFCPGGVAVGAGTDVNVAVGCAGIGGFVGGTGTTGVKVLVGTGTTGVNVFVNVRVAVGVPVWVGVNVLVAVGGIGVEVAVDCGGTGVGVTAPASFEYLIGPELEKGPKNGGLPTSVIKNTRKR